MNPKNSHKIHILLFDASHCIRRVGSSFLGTWFGGLTLNQISNTCLEVAAPRYNVQKSLMSRLHPLSRDTPKAPRYPRRSISTPQWGISWHPGTWSRRIFWGLFLSRAKHVMWILKFALYVCMCSFVFACGVGERRHDAILCLNQTALQCNKETTYKLYPPWNFRVTLGNWLFRYNSRDIAGPNVHFTQITFPTSIHYKMETRIGTKWHVQL